MAEAEENGQKLGLTIDQLDNPKSACGSNGVDSMARSMEKPRSLEDITDKTKPWQLTEIVDPVQCRLVTMPDGTDTASMVARLLYTNSGVGILALGSNGIQKLWKWARNEQNPSGKVMTTFMPPPPTLTFLAFHPQDNNIIAIGMEDSTIHIYNVRVDEVKSKLRGHQKKITGLAFSTNLNILVSSGFQYMYYATHQKRMEELAGTFECMIYFGGLILN